MNHKQNLGQLGEEYAIKYLLQNKYKIIARNFRCRLGEIDIIATKENILIFIEVKTRRNTNYGYPVESITKTKQKHIYNTASYYILSHNIRKIDIRIDAIEVYAQFNNIKINHIKGIINSQIK